jgi:T5SS/PEP-CTERM-associated repeat protein
MRARSCLFDLVRLAPMVVAAILVRLADPAAASVTSIGSVNPVPPTGGGTFTTSWVVGDQQAANPDTRAWVNITDGTPLEYGSLVIGDEELFQGTVNVVGDFLAGKNTTLTLSASLAGGVVNNPTLQVGRAGTGYLNVRGGATMTLSNNFSDMSIGHQQTGVGYVTVSDPFSMLTLGEDLFVGNAGMGRLEVLDGALVRTTSTSTLRSISIGATATGVGTVVVDGIGSLLRAGSKLVVGNDGTSAVGDEGTGSLTIGHQAIVDVDNTSSATVTVGMQGRVDLDGGILIGQTPTSGFGTTVNGILGGSGLVRGSVAFGATGSLEVGPGDLLQFTGDASNQGSATIEGGELQFLAGFTNNAQGVLPAPGRMSLEDGTVRFAEPLTNDGVISSSRGTNNFHGAITNMGSVVVASDTVAVFHDTFTVPGSVEVKPRGNALFLANMVFTSAALLEIGVGMDGTTDTSAQIAVAGSVSLGGSLTVDVTGGLTPVLGQTFDLITAGNGISGIFNSISVPDIPGMLEYRVVYNPTSVLLVVADETMATPNGDFNGDHVVDAADYVVWRNGLGTTFTLADYDVWRANFGRTFGSGAGSAIDAAAGGAVPEPGSLLLVGLALLLCATKKSAA